MKKGFTLIELLSVIIILAIILVIVVPQILSVINSTKQNLDETQKRLVYSSVEKYVLDNSIDILDKEQILINDLVLNEYIETPKNNIGNFYYLPTTGIIVKNTNGRNEYYFSGYITDGLILHYDGIDNAGYGLNVDNSSLNKNTWKDISLYDNDATLNNFDYNSSSGWENNGLRFDGINDNFNSNIINQYSNDGYTVEVYLNCDVYKYAQLSFGATELKLRIISQNEYWNTRRSDGNYMTIGINYPNKILLNENTHFSFSYDKVANQYVFSKDKVFYNRNVSSFITDDMRVVFGGELLSGKVFAVRVYDRKLSEEELNQNYEIDKIRFN